MKERGHRVDERAKQSRRTYQIAAIEECRSKRLHSQSVPLFGEGVCNDPRTPDGESADDGADAASGRAPSDL